MLIKCPECELQISDKATFCPHCGYPNESKESVKKSRNKPAKRKKLPNGFGSITKLKNRNLRKPFWARICVGKSPTGRPILKSLKPDAYFKTYNEAYMALVEYNKNPYDLESAITVQELYEKWTTEYLKNSSSTYSRTISSAWSYCSSVYTMRAKDLRARHIKGCMEEGFRIETRGKKKGEKIYASPGTKSRIKSLFNNMLDYALEFEIVERNYARTFEISSDIIKEQENAKRGHVIFKNEELQKLWDNVYTTVYVDWVLIQCYMGWRPQELALLKIKDVDLNNWTITGGMKTEAGKQRTVPIHSRIRELIKKNYAFAESINSEYLFNAKGQTHAGSWTLTYDKYANRFKQVIATLELNPQHRAHDPRKTFVTMAKKAKISDNAIKALIGHKPQDITESAYTERDIEWLREDIEKIK